ncbi:MAG: site-specific DNA-methyltransferase [Bacteroidia bacterium]|nr:site-specific DNA-methyltransferase [Bacteroidia bacterium]MDW8159077.1 site-specific DNA-methyltransferase [Bacteroidia bacterium]
METNKVENKKRAPNNRTLTVSENERKLYSSRLLRSSVNKNWEIHEIINRTIHADIFDILEKLPRSFADLIIIDPPYNLDKNFHGLKFKSLDSKRYLEYLRSWFPQVVQLLKNNGSIYLCGDWRCSAILQHIMEENNIIILNRITWQREKGRGATKNWKNTLEDIWFGVKNKNDYYFNVEAVKQKRRVIAPYKSHGEPKDWEQTKNGKFRLTYPSNFWDDISIPYWSMPENTEHPTQKPEKLIAKLILASCPLEGVVFDPFLGSGTTSVVAKKLNRKYVGVEINEEYCIWAEKRLALAEYNSSIQGYAEGVFWERNTFIMQKKLKAAKNFD